MWTGDRAVSWWRAVREPAACFEREGQLVNIDRSRGWIRQIPNSLTWLRLGLALSFPWAPEKFWIAVFVIAALTEFLDGYLARRLNVSSRFGALFDPIADKAFLFVVAATLLWRGYLPWWDLLLVGLRDLFVLGGAIVFAMQGRRNELKQLKARWPGKLTTALQFALLLTVLATKQSFYPLVGLTTLAGVWAIFDYVAAYRKACE